MQKRTEVRELYNNALKNFLINAEVRNESTKNNCVWCIESKIANNEDGLLLFAKRSKAQDFFLRIVTAGVGVYDGLFDYDVDFENEVEILRIYSENACGTDFGYFKLSKYTIL